MSQTDVHQQHQECSDACSLCSNPNPSLNHYVTCKHHCCPTCENSESTANDGCPVCLREIQTFDISGLRDSSGEVQQEAAVLSHDHHDGGNQEKDNVIESHNVKLMTSSALGARRHSDRCSQHPTEVVRMFCSDCETSFCVKCFFQTHKDHTVEDVDEASGKLRGKLNDYITRLSAQLASQSANGVSRRVDNEIIDRIDERVSKVRTVVDQCDEQLRQSLEQVLRQRKLDWEFKKSKDLELRTEGNSLIEACSALVVDGRPVDILTEFKQVESRLLQLENVIRSSLYADVNMNHDECLELVELDLDKYLPHDRRNLIGTVAHSRQELANFEQQKSYEELENELRREKDQNSELKKEIMTLGRTHATQLSQIDGEWRDKLAKATHELNIQLETTKTRYEYDMAKLKEEHCIQLKEALEAASTRSNPSVSTSNEEIIRIAQGHASQLNQAEKKIAHLETTLAEYRKAISELNAEHDRKLERMQSEHKRELLKHKQETEQKTGDFGDVKRASDAKTTKSSESENNDSSNDIDSVYERNRQVITSPVVKTTVLKSPLLKSISKKASIDQEQEQEDKVVFKQSTSTGRKTSSSSHVIKECNNGTTDTQSRSKTIGTDLSSQKTVSLKQQVDKMKDGETIEEQKSPVRRTRSSITSQETSPHYSCNPSDIDAESIYSAYQDVLNDSSHTSWLILGYEDRKIVLLSTGSDYDAFKSSFTDDRGLYGFTRIISGDELSKRPKFVLIMWIGSDVGAPAAAKMTLGKSIVKAVIKHLAIEVQATTVEHLELDVLMESLKKAGGANYGTGI